MAIGHKVDSEPKLLQIDELDSNRLLDELVVMRTTSRELREHEVVNFEAPRDDRSSTALRGRDLEPHQAFFPASRSNDGFRADSMSVVVVCLMKPRPVPDCAVDLLRSLRVTSREDIYFGRYE